MISQIRPLVKHLSLCVFAVSAIACEDEDDVVKTCTVDGVKHRAGDEFPSPDGCNTCTCGQDGVASCTTRACVTTCTYDGATHEVGDEFPATDGCNSCTCEATGRVSCTEKACVVTCTVGDKTYDVGDQFPDADGCNTCTCNNDGGIACTDRACVDTCNYDRREWQVGDEFPAIDGCNTCECLAGGTVSCTEKNCTTTCEVDGTTYEVGEQWEHSDGCNTCTCMDTGVPNCTKIACPVTCTYDRQEWEVGEQFPAIDGCNTCTCGEDGQIACTEMACLTCDPETDWWRSYAATSLEECMVIRFVCPENTTQFHNDCGCGCEQSDKCEQEIECYFPDCNPSETQAGCPYSTIDTSRDCSAEMTCPNDGSMCREPGASFGCGICFNPPEDTTCADDSVCDKGFICEPVRCACAGQRTCVQGCTGDDTCEIGESCGDDFRCHPTSCTDGRPCPDNFACVGEVCQRKTCEASTACEGYCVNGNCYDAPGDCSGIPQ